LRQPNRLGALLPFDSGENAINPNAGILKISKQISDRYPFTINADQTEIHFTLNQNRHTRSSKTNSHLSPDTIIDAQGWFRQCEANPGRFRLRFFS
jgi:hypothetical protein